MALASSNYEGDREAPVYGGRELHPPPGMAVSNSSFFSGFSKFAQLSDEEAKKINSMAKERVGRAESFQRGRKVFENNSAQMNATPTTESSYRKESTGNDRGSIEILSKKFESGGLQLSEANVMDVEKDEGVSMNRAKQFTASRQLFESFNAKRGKEKDDFTDIAELIEDEVLVAKTKEECVGQKKAIASQQSSAKRAPQSEIPKREVAKEGLHSRDCGTELVRQWLKKDTARSLTFSQAQTGPTATSASIPNVLILYHDDGSGVRELVRSLQEGIEGVRNHNPVRICRVSSASGAAKDAVLDPTTKSGVELLTSASAVLFGFPVVCADMHEEMKRFFHSLSAFRKDMRLAGKPAGVFTTSTRNGGRVDLAQLNAVAQLIQLGLIYVPIGFSLAPIIFNTEESNGATPFGCSAVQGCKLTEKEIGVARYQGAFTSLLTRRFANAC